MKKLLILLCGFGLLFISAVHAMNLSPDSALRPQEALGKLLQAGSVNSQLLPKLNKELSDFDQALLYLKKNYSQMISAADLYKNRFLARPITECLRLLASILYLMSLVVGISGVASISAFVYYLGPLYVTRFYTLTMQFIEILKHVAGPQQALCMIKNLDGSVVQGACSVLMNNIAKPEVVSDATAAMGVGNQIVTQAGPTIMEALFRMF